MPLDVGPPVGVDVDADHPLPRPREQRGGRQPDMAETDDTDLGHSVHPRDYSRDSRSSSAWQTHLLSTSRR